MEILFKQTWIMFIVVTVANALILKHRSKQYIAQQPNLQEGYDLIFKGILLYGNIPWLIMAIGNLSGLTNSPFDYFMPRTMNSMVLIFHGAIIVLWILSVRWIYFKNGAEFLARHPGLLRKSSFSGNTSVTATQIRIFFALALLGGIAGMLMMWLIDFPAPSFPG